MRKKPLKTILVVYSNNRGLTTVELGRLKKYAFNTSSDVAVGDILESSEYSTNLVVAHVFPGEAMGFYNSATGDLSATRSLNSNVWEIRELVVGEPEKDVVYAKKVVK